MFRKCRSLLAPVNNAVCAALTGALASHVTTSTHTSPVTATETDTIDNGTTTSSTSTNNSKAPPRRPSPKELMADVDKHDPQYQTIFQQRFRDALAQDTYGLNELDGFLELPDGVSPSAASVSAIRRGEAPLPPWLKLKVPKGMTHRPRFNRIRRSMREKKLSTVCEEAKCPNIGECWGGDEGEGSATATIMVMGSHCTRGCRFCSVLTSRRPPPLDPLEPQKIAAAVQEMGVDYIVMTMVDRDDLIDGGAEHVCGCIHAIKERSPHILLEALVGDFHGDLALVEQVARAPLSVYAHNIECVERVTSHVRDRRASYRQSLKTLEHVARCASAWSAQTTAEEGSSHTKRVLLTKSSIMLGLGEEEAEVRQTLRDLRTAGVSAVTLGQYLQPSRTRLKVSRYAHPKEFEAWEKEAKEMGFVYCASGPMVRSSYRAGEFYMKSILKPRQEERGDAKGGEGGS